MYAKLFSQIYDSSIVEDYATRCVFMDLLVLADRHGIVDMTHDAIARRTNAPIETVRAAIDKLCKPDPDSRTPDHDGRRLIKLDEHRDWGWFIVNYCKYRNTKDEKERTKYMRQYMANYRKKHGLCPSKKKGASLTAVNSVNKCKPKLTHTDTDTEADTDTNTKKENTPPSSTGGSRNPYSDAFVDAYMKVHNVKYVPQKADFVQLAKWKKEYPGITPVGFAWVAEQLWFLGQFTPKYSMTMRGLCSSWSEAAVKSKLNGKSETKTHPAIAEMYRKSMGVKGGR